MFIEESPIEYILVHISSLIFLIIVWISKKKKFKRVVGIEHMLRMKKFSTSDVHFQFGVFIPLIAVALFIGFFKFFYTSANPHKNSVGRHT